jgi:centromere/kinetochore protein ZW10
MHQDETESCIDSAVARVRSMAVTWESILARSVWYQAVGSLVDAISSKIIADVMDMAAIGQDEAYNIANMIATVTELDDLFLPSRFQQGAGKRADESDEVPTTAQYASTWLRLKYLSEVLQSNLKDLRYLWMESELSFYFSVDEVLELINLSFEDNPRTREVVREITHNPHPRQEEVRDGW